MSSSERGTWASRSTFILAAIGSAVGLGNAWRFPGLVAKHGGGAFLLAYLLAMFALGIPLLMMEISIGRKMRAGAPNAMKGLNKKFEAIGWAATANAGVIVVYYAVVFAWVILMTIFSFKFASMTGDTAAAKGLWMDLIKTTGTVSGFGIISWKVVICVVIAWGLMYFCIRKGTHSVGKVVKYTVFLPVLCLVAMAVKGVTMPGAMEGIKALFVPDFSALGSASLWIDAVGQVFYSMSVMMAIMFAYGSFLDRKSNIAEDCMVIAFSDMAVSVLAGIVLFTTMYGSGMTTADMSSSGIGTAFMIYPMTIVTLTESGIFNAIFAFIFYFCLCTLAIDSSFSIVEGVSAAVADKFKFDKHKTTLTICLIGVVISMFFTTGAGLACLDIVDNWCNCFSLVLVGVLESLAIGWGFSTDKIMAEINLNTKKFKMPAWWFKPSVKFISPAALAVFFIWNIVTLIQNGGIYGKADGYTLMSNILGGWLIFALVLVSGFIVRGIAGIKEKRDPGYTQDSPSWDDME
ncbi:MAG: sodium-dependent transporter [Clostridia bacterium]|nr:sodium-dependent transporter [Clostridia bacterium]